jgi:LysR family transcriptional regulator, hydrogen peroxide-inducible genes activator
MEVHQLIYFCALARTGNFSRAAEQCHVAQPSLSQQIRKLEEEFGEPLIQRGRGPARLTALGERFLPRAQLILREIAAAKEEAASFATLARGRVRLGAIPTVAPYLLPALVERLRAHAPGIELVFHEGTTESLLRQLQEGTLDFALASPPFPAAARLDYEELREDELLVALPDDHPLAGEATIEMAALGEEPLVLMHESHCLSRQTRALCQARGMQPGLTIESAQLDTALALVAAHQGLTLVPAMAREALSRHPVRFVRLAPRSAFRSVGLAWPSARLLTRAQEAFLGAARELRAIRSPG